MKRLKETSLAETHRRLGAKMIEFAGWLMPVNYSKGIIKEHLSVRSGVGIFDVSHMGELRVRGAGAFDFMDRMMTNLVPRAKGEVVYTPLCYDDGGIVDDVTVYCLGEDDLMVVVNAANTDKDLSRLVECAPDGVDVIDESAATSLIAVQGPNAVALVSETMGAGLSELDRFRHTEIELMGERAVVSRTGYTGEDGFEIYVAQGLGPAVWSHLMDEGRRWSPEPVGLGARDTLRFEASYRLYGNDIDETTSPLEAGLGWTVKFSKREFIGRDALVRQREQGLKRKFVGFGLSTKRIARKGCAIWVGGESVGTVTSGAYAPYLDRSLAMGYVPLDLARVGGEVELELKGARVTASIAKLPFFKR